MCREVAEIKKDYLVLSSQIKLLMELPELIWKRLDSGNICEATQIQQLGSHLHLGLFVESGASQGGNAQKWFPIISRQKITLDSFYEVIVKESTTQLKAVQLSLEVKPTNQNEISNCLFIDFLSTKESHRLCVLLDSAQRR